MITYSKQRIFYLILGFEILFLASCSMGSKEDYNVKAHEFYQKGDYDRVRIKSWGDGMKC